MTPRRRRELAQPISPRIHFFRNLTRWFGPVHQVQGDFLPREMKRHPIPASHPDRQCMTPHRRQQLVRLSALRDWAFVKPLDDDVEARQRVFGRRIFRQRRQQPTSVRAQSIGQIRHTPPRTEPAAAGLGPRCIDRTASACAMRAYRPRGLAQRWLVDRDFDAAGCAGPAFAARHERPEQPLLKRYTRHRRPAYQHRRDCPPAPRARRSPRNIVREEPSRWRVPSDVRARSATRRRSCAAPRSAGTGIHPGPPRSATNWARTTISRMRTRPPRSQ